ncbi:tyrosine-type recombinase/integrase [Nitrobacter vulgaris]|uniref:tyrosine-type recombinase/integrase n=1 Tax=Nitrobacter vulgaris TaxID=29421 RepID=UPI00286D3667|nr:tyrosine-type recombinase/integrase [Nitrobacter vulgaris]
MDLSARTWTVPGNGMKAGREHRVPLSDEAVEILKELPREKNNPYVFIGPRAGGLSNMAMAAVLRRMDRLDITVHGFRSTFRDWAAESTAFPNHVVEMALAHTVGNKVEAAYRRGDLIVKRQRLAADWAHFCAREGIGKERSSVIPIRSKT